MAKLPSFRGCVLAEYVWLDADGVTRSKTMTMTARSRDTALPISDFHSILILKLCKTV